MKVLFVTISTIVSIGAHTKLPGIRSSAEYSGNNWGNSHVPPNRYHRNQPEHLHCPSAIVGTIKSRRLTFSLADSRQQPTFVLHGGHIARELPVVSPIRMSRLGPLQDLPVAPDNFPALPSPPCPSAPPVRLPPPLP